MRYLALFLSAGLMAQEPQLNIVIVEGEGATNNIRQRPVRSPIVEVQDADHRPVAGAVVVFTLPEQGAGGEFAGGAHSLTVVADGQGRAAARGFRPNGLQGQFQIRVNASANGRTGKATIDQTNESNVGGGHGKLIAILAAAGAAATAGALYATHSGGGSVNSATIPAGASTTTTGHSTVH